MDVNEEKPETPERIETIADRLAFKSRFVMLFGEINHAVARATCTRLIALAEESEGPVPVLISSPGGHVESGDAIHDIIRFVRAPVTTVGTGWAARAGTHVFLAAPKGRRGGPAGGAPPRPDPFPRRPRGAGRLPAERAFHDPPAGRRRRRPGDPARLM